MYMKKITTLCLSLLCFAGVAQAQQNNKTFRFVEKHANGTTTEIPDGSTLNYTAADAEETPFGTQIKQTLYVENTTGDLKAIALTLNIASINEGAAIQFCVAGNCRLFDAAGEYVKNAMEAGKNLDDMMLEYIPKSDMDDEDDIIYFDGAAAITLRADVCEYTEEETNRGTKKYTYGDVIGVGPQITINFNFNYTGIQDAQNPDNGIVKEVARYNGAGQRVNGPVKGLNIVKLANGKTVKQIYK